jgi:outer membrane receptor protein involved in Fe transport
VQDLYESRYHSSGGGIWRYGNANLKPEFSRSLDAGVEWGPAAGLSIRGNGYYNRLADMITLVRGTRDSAGIAVPRDTMALNGGKMVKVPVWERINIDSYRIGGFDGAVGWRFKYGGVEVGGSAVWHSSDDPRSADALQYPGQKVFGKLSGDVPVGLGITCNGFIGAQRVFNRHAPTGGGALRNYTNLEAGLGAVLMGKYEVYVKGRNLLGQEQDMYEDALWTIEGEPLFEGGVKVNVF